MHNGYKNKSKNGKSVETNKSYKIDDKIDSQLKSRGWIINSIDKTIKKGPTGSTIDKRRPNKTPDNLGRNDPATVYGTKDGYIIVNNRTKEIVQISDKTDPNWIPDSRIEWKNK